MNWEAIGAIGEVVGAVAVIATLMYLAIQLRQNTTSLQTSAYQQWTAIHTQTFGAYQTHGFSELMVQGCLDSRNLTNENYLQFMVWMRQYFHMQQAQYYLYEKGVIEDELWESNLKDVVGIYRYPGVHQLWEAGLKSGFTNKFVELVETSVPSATMMLWDKERGFYASPYHEDTE